MQNKTPIMVLTGLGIVAAAAVAGLTRDHWMGQTPQVVATAPEATTAAPDAGKSTTPEAPKATEQAATTPAPAAPATSEQPATAAPTQAAEPAKTETTQQTASAQPEAQPEQPAATNAGDKPEVPTFDTVRVEKTGEAVIAGKAVPGADVVIMLDGAKIGETTANSDGAFVVVPDKPLPAGSGALTIEAKAKGETQPTPSEQSVAVIVPAADQKQEALVAVVSPDQPTKVLQKPEVKAEEPAAEATAAAPAETADTGTTTAAPAEKPAKLVSIDAVDYDPAGNIVFSGQGEQGNTARVYIDNAFIGDAPVGADGRWSFSGTAKVSEGVHTLRVDGLDASGKVLNRVEVPFFREQQSKVADAAAAQQPAQTTTEPAQTAEPAQQQSADTAPAAQPTPAAQPEATTAEQGTAQPQPSATPATEAATAADAGQAAATPAKPREGRVVIQPGNNLWRISRVLYGSGAKFTTLYEANKDQIRNPNRIYPGQVFRTPDVSATSGAVDPKRREPLKPEENAVSGQ